LKEWLNFDGEFCVEDRVLGCDYSLSAVHNLVAIGKDHVLVLKVIYDNTDEETLFIKSSCLLASIRHIVQESRGYERFVFQDSGGTTLNDDFPVKGAVGPLKCVELVSVTCDIGSRDYVVNVPKGGKVGDVAELIAKEFGTSADCIHIVLAERVLAFELSIGSLALKPEWRLGVFIKLDPSVLRPVVQALGL
jgi:hypothetical protein